MLMSLASMAGDLAIVLPSTVPISQRLESAVRTVLSIVGLKMSYPMLAISENINHKQDWWCAHTDMYISNLCVFASVSVYICISTAISIHLCLSWSDWTCDLRLLLGVLYHTGGCNQTVLSWIFFFIFNVNISILSQSSYVAQILSEYESKSICIHLIYLSLIFI